jgi:hypothetical protein
MIEWELYITYDTKPYKLKAALEYHSSQIMRIRVHGIKSTLLLENDYPTIKASNGKRGIKWKIREGQVPGDNKATARLLIDIFEKLEYHIKNDYPFTSNVSTS